MRYLFLGLICFSGVAFAGAVPDNFSQAKFEQRFHAADKDRNGMLSRAEAYAEFPRMPEFFDEIDANKDNRITLAEVKRAMEKRVDAAMSAGSTGSKYGGASSSTNGGNASGGGANADPQFASKAEAARAQRYDYYESLAASLDSARDRGEPAQPEPYPTLLKKSF